jgi:hypothetical protein
MTSLASREMTEQEMVNTCTAPQMAHLIQVLRQTIRNKDKEIDRLVDMVSQLQLDPPEPKPLLADAKVGDLCKTDLDEWIQIDDAPEPPSPILYHIDRPFKGNIIHTEPLAPEGTAEWAWQMLVLGKKIARTSWRSGCYYVIHNGFVRHVHDSNMSDFQYDPGSWKARTAEVGKVWIIYKEQPEPSFKVGDWVETEIGFSQVKVTEIKPDGSYWSGDYKLDKITRKLDPSEVVIHIGCLSGTVRQCGDKEEEVFALCTNHNAAVIPFTMCDPATRSLVESILRAQEEKC